MQAMITPSHRPSQAVPATPLPNTPPTAAPAPFFGPTVVRAAFVLAVFGWGVGFYGPPIFLHAVMQRSGWPLLLVSSAVTLHFLAGVLVIAWLPRLHQRCGVARMVIAGSVLTALGVCGWAIAAQPWQLALAAVASGMGWVNLGAVTVNAVVARWHQRTRPLALARAYNGASIGGVIFTPLWVLLIAQLGFGWAAVIIGGTMVAVLAWLSLQVFARSPQQLGQQLDGDDGSQGTGESKPPPRAAAWAQQPPLPGAAMWRNRSFQTLALGMALGLFAQVGLLAHLFSLLVPRLGASAAGWVMGACTACAIAGRSAAARLLMRVDDRRRVAASSHAAQAIGSLVLAFTASALHGSALPAVLLGIALFGLGIGNATSLPPLIAQSDFSAPDVPRVVALIVAIAQAGYAFAPAVFGALLAAGADAPSHTLPNAQQADGHGALILVTAAVLQLAAAAALLAGRQRAPASPAQ